MRAVIQRGSEAAVAIAGRPRGRIGPGLLVLLGVGEGDTGTDADYVARKVAEVRIYEDDEGKMNRSRWEPPSYAEGFDRLYRVRIRDGGDFEVTEAPPG